ncbi:hypothetical protein ACHQM5_003902 [Ranunculus cassubicifolius]
MGLSSSTLGKNTAEESGSKITPKVHQPLSSKVDELVSGVSRVTSSVFREIFITQTSVVEKMEDNEVLHMKIMMPGLSRDDVQVSVNKNSQLIVHGGEGINDKENQKLKIGMRYKSKHFLPSDRYKVDEIKAEMKDGVLMVMVPKIAMKEEKKVIIIPVD